MGKLRTRILAPRGFKEEPIIPFAGGLAAGRKAGKLAKQILKGKKMKTFSIGDIIKGGKKPALAAKKAKKSKVKTFTFDDLMGE